MMPNVVCSVIETFAIHAEGSEEGRSKSCTGLRSSRKRDKRDRQTKVRRIR